MRLLLVVVALLIACGDNHEAPPDARVDAQVDAPPTGCTTDANCNDNDACTTDTCSTAHECVHTPKAVDDQIACTTDTCNPATGDVTHTPVNSVCEVDGKSCTVATCSATTGCSETPTQSVCNDGRSCSTDSCDPSASGADAATGCTHTLDDNACTDAFSCTTNTCSPTAIAADTTTGCLVTPNNNSCGDSISCTTDTCNPTGSGADAAGCVHQTVDSACEVDGKSCTVATCSATNGCSETPTQSVCDDGRTCSTDSCDPTANGADAATGCAHVLDDNACSDAFACTTNTCSPTAIASDTTTGCLAAPNDGACGDSISCTTDACNPAGNGADAAGCTHQTVNSLCEVDGKSCTVATCSATTGCSETPTNSLCDDNATCSTDTCSPTGPGATGCVFTLDNAICADTAECSTDACSPGANGANGTTGCLHTADASACSTNATCSNVFDCACNGGYTGNGVTCTPITCDPLSDPVNGSVLISNGGLFPSTATYSCNTGFAAVPSTTRTCNTDGTWSGSAPTCDPTFFVVRVGEGTAVLSSASTAVFLEERNSAGTVVRTINLPIAADGSNAPFTLAGTSTTEGGLSRSANGAYITLAGYAVVPGITGPNSGSINTTTNRSTDTSPTNRVVARVSAAGVVDSSTRLVDAFSGSSVRAACTADGTAFWLTGTSSPSGTGGVQYATLGSTGAPTQVFSTINNLRHAHVFASQLYVTSASGTGTHGLFAVGSGLPTTTGQTTTSIVPLSDTSNPDSFAVLDVDANVAGLDTIYIALDSGGTAGKVNIQKWTFNGSAWSQATTFAPTVTGTSVPNTLGLATWIDSSNAVHIIVTTSEPTSRILMIVDDGVTAAPAATVLASATTNTAFRGVARSPTQ